MIFILLRNIFFMRTPLFLFFVISGLFKFIENTKNGEQLEIIISFILFSCVRLGIFFRILIENKNLIIGVGLMTKVKSSVFLSLLLGGCLNAQDEHEPMTLSSLAHDMSMVSDAQEQRTLLKIEQAAQKLEDDIAKKTEVLKAGAAEASHKIFMDYAEQKENIITQAQTQECELKKQAAQRILELITKAEEEALHAKNKARQALLKEKLETLKTGGTDWKQELKQSFMQNLDYLRDIINQGESTDEAAAFSASFDEQSQWLDTMLATTKNMTQPGYYQLEQKRAALENIVNAQKNTEAFLQEKIKSEKQVMLDFASLRLIALYDINSVMHQKSGDGIAALAATELTKEEAASIASSIINSDKAAQVKQKARDTKNRLLLAEQEIAQLKAAVQEEQKNRQQAEQKAILLDDYADRRIHEYKLYYDTKKTLLSERAPTKTETISQQEHAMREDLEHEIAKRNLLERK